MALKPCRECKKEVSSGASACPHCGAKVPTMSRTVRVVMGLFFAWALFAVGRMVVENGGPVGTVQAQVNRSVVDDVLAQYETAKQGGNAMDVCIHAGIVKAAFIQAKDAAGTKNWDRTERADCGRAGVPR
jgi:hypothetical protein